MEQLLSGARILWQAHTSADLPASRSRTAQLLAVLLALCGFGWYAAVQHILPAMVLTDVPQFTLSSIVAIICAFRLLWLKRYLERAYVPWQSLQPTLPFLTSPLAHRVAIWLTSIVLRARLMVHIILLQRSFPDQAFNTLLDTLRLLIALWQLHVRTPEVGRVLTRELRYVLRDVLAWMERLGTLLQDQVQVLASLLLLSTLQNLFSPFKPLLCPITQRPTIVVLRC